MRINLFLSTFFLYFSLSVGLHAQPTGSHAVTDHWFDWQRQVLDAIDETQTTEVEYARLLEMLYDLEFQNHISPDTLTVPDSLDRRPHYSRLRQSLVLSADRCLNLREGYRQATSQRQALNKAFLGDPIHETVRYQLSYRDNNHGSWRAGLVLDKDAGERWRTSPPWADSFSLYAMYSRSDGLLRQCLAGHYRVSLGCGLLCGQSFSLGKSMLTSAYMQHHPTLAPHSSASEADHMQGAAAHMRLSRHVALTSFLSVRSLDGRLQHDTITSFPSSSYHRTNGEEALRHAVCASLAGASLRWANEWTALSFNALYTHFNHPYAPARRLYNSRTFRGSDLPQASLYYDTRWWYLHMRGEVALSPQGGIAMLHGVQGTLADRWRTLLLYRHYNDHYRQLWCNAVSESSLYQAEQGLTLSADGALLPHLDLQLMADWFHFSRPQFRIDQPSSGYELSSRLLYQLQRRSHDWRLSCRYRLKSKYRNDTETVLPGDIIPFRQHTFDAVAQYISPLGLTTRTQLQQRIFALERCSVSTSTGWALSQSLGWRRDNCPVRAELQGTLFHAADYDSRLYINEPNILYGFGLPMLQGEGWRASALLRWRLTSHINFEAKYARTNYRHQSTIGSGLLSIRGHHQDHLWCQITLK